MIQRGWVGVLILEILMAHVWEQNDQGHLCIENRDLQLQVYYAVSSREDQIFVSHRQFP